MGSFHSFVINIRDRLLIMMTEMKWTFGDKLRNFLRLSALTKAYESSQYKRHKALECACSEEGNVNCIEQENLEVSFAP